MNMTYNGVSNPRNMLTFSDVHNILKVKDDVVGTLTSISITISPTSTSSDGQYYITLLGETVTSVVNPSNASNKRFYLGNSIRSCRKSSVAISSASSLLNCNSEIILFNKTTYSEFNPTLIIGLTFV